MSLSIMALGVPLIFVMVLLTNAMKSFVEKVTLQIIQQAQNSYAEAGSVAEESISSIKTVTTFGLQKLFQEKYEKAVRAARDIGIKNGLITG